MKNSVRYLATALSLVAVQPLTRAADDAKPAPKDEKKEMRVLSGPDHHVMIRRLGEKETVAYLGVETAPASATLAAQLGLPEGSGLVVNRVLSDTPAAGALQEHDILLKLDDQILIDPHQLAVLIRTHKEGDEVTLTYLRGGKQATARVKLAKHDVPKMSLLPLEPGSGINVLGLGQMFPRHEPGAGGDFEYQIMPPAEQPRTSHDIDHLLGLMELSRIGGPGVQRLNIRRDPGPGDRTVSVTVNTGDSHIVLDDDQGSLDLTIKDGKKTLVAKNKAGEQLFAGPINTPEERKALPDEVRGRLEKLEDSAQFNFKVDRDFQGAETRVLRPRGESIALPLPPVVAPAPRRAPAF